MSSIGRSEESPYLPQSRSGAVIPELTIVVLAFNEEEALEATVEEVVKTFAGCGIAFDLVLVDDGSSDGTPAICAKLSRRYEGLVSAVSHERNLGMGAAIRTGLAVARGTWVGILPGDGQFGPADMRRLFEARESCEFVAGDVTASSRLKSDNLLRLLLSWGMRTVLRLLHPRMPRFNGVMVLRKQAVQVERLVCTTGLVHLEILDRGRRQNVPARIHYLPITIRPRIAGRSKMTNVRTIITIIGDMARLRLCYLLGR